jgi:putative tryptophan/tyrosine transport system substrate-binding protein
MLNRREFITVFGGAAIAPSMLSTTSGAGTQRTSTPVVGYFNARSPESDAHLVAAFRRGLEATGYVEGKNVAIEYRWAEGQFDRQPSFAADLVARSVAVIFAGGGDAGVRVVKAATSTIPIVFATGGDPVEMGLVASLNRPEANATGITVISSALWPKRLELLAELAPNATTIALFVNPRHPSAEASTKQVQSAARTLGRRVLVLNIGSRCEFEAAFASLVEQGARALLVANDPVFIDHREQLVALCALHAVPAIYDRREFVSAGGLMSYGASIVEQYRQAGVYTGRILRGAKPGELPVVQPTKFDLIINLATAEALGLTVPAQLLALADEVME